MKKMRGLSGAAALVATMALPGLAVAQTVAPPVNVVGLQASATEEVTKDLLSVSMSTTREGADAATVQNQLKQALDAALAEARKASKPGQIDVRTGNFSVSPRYAKGGTLNGWQGTAELLLEGRDVVGIAQLSGRIGTLTVSRVTSQLSREQREKVESDVAVRAIAAYRAKAGDYAKQFGFTGYTLREINVGTNEPVYGQPMFRMNADAAVSSSSAAVPVELGRGTVTVTVNGTVQLTK